MIVIGFGVFYSGIWRRIALTLGIVFSLVFWIVGQSLGGYFTGLATDPNSGPLFVLLALAIFGCNDLDSKLSNFGHKIEYAIVGKPNDGP